VVVGEQLAHLGPERVPFDLVGEQLAQRRVRDLPSPETGRPDRTGQCAPTDRFTDRFVEAEHPGPGRLEHLGGAGHLLQPGGLTHDLVGSLPAPHGAFRRQAPLCPQDRVQQAGGAGEP
jgi:hypothetical protein